MGEKGNTEGSERRCRESLYRGTKIFWQSMWKTYARFLTSFNTKHLVLWTTLKTLEIEWRNRLKDLWIRSGLHSRKVQLSHVKYLHAFLSNLNFSMSLPSVQTTTKEDEVGMGMDWIENFPPVCQQTVRSESTQDKAISLPPASQDYVMLFVIFLKS